MKNGKRIFVGVVTLGLLLGSVRNAAAITHGQLDGDGLLMSACSYSTSEASQHCFAAER
jgi:hypothetical protein